MWAKRGCVLGGRSVEWGMKHYFVAYTLKSASIDGVYGDWYDTLSEAKRALKVTRKKIDTRDCWIENKMGAVIMYG
jgi:hypothetical protein